MRHDIQAALGRAVRAAGWRVPNHAIRRGIWQHGAHTYQVSARDEVFIRADGD